MAGESSDTVRQWLESFKQHEREKDEMYLEVGKAIVNLSVIEEYMASVFVILSRPMAEDAAAAMFYESQNMAHKLKLVGYAVMRTDWAAGKRDWPTLSAKIGKQRFVRNLAAHASMGFTLEKDGKRWRLSLATQELDKKHKRTELKIADMKASADELDDLRRLIQEFLIRTLRHLGPEVASS